jgi:protein TonB
VNVVPALYQQQELPGRRWALPASIALHGLLLAWLLHTPRPVFVAPSSALGGVGGATVTHLYWPLSPAEGATLAQAAVKKEHAQSSRQPVKLRYPRPKSETPANPPEESAEPLEASTANDPAAAIPGRSAGSPYGSLSEGPDTGEDVRPALPVVTSEPMLSDASLAGIAEGNCVVEITIDETGTVVAESVQQSMGPAIDEAVVAAVGRWHFQPATRNGVPIPSRQDVVYHFKPHS